MAICGLSDNFKQQAVMSHLQRHFKTLERQILTFIMCLGGMSTFSQTNLLTKESLDKSATPKFHLYYGFSGLGSNMGSFQPTIKVKGTNFLYTYEQNSYYGEKNKRVDTVCVKAFRQSSIDSIIDIIKDLKDTLIIEYNFCIMSGGIHFLTIVNGNDTTGFQLSNTFHYTALKITSILNEYAPKDKQIWANEQMIKDAEDCLTYLFKGADKNKKRKRKSIKTKNGT
jgi:hypothetical protein